MTQEQLAERLGTTKATISRIENRQEPCALDFLEMAADVLGIHHSTLVTREPTPADRLPVAARSGQARRAQR